MIVDAAYRVHTNRGPVEDKAIVGIKSVEAIATVHKMQLLTYLRLADKRLGLLMNFNVALIRDGITRIVNQLQE